MASFQTASVGLRQSHIDGLLDFPRFPSLVSVVSSRVEEGHFEAIVLRSGAERLRLLRGFDLKGRHHPALATTLHPRNGRTSLDELVALGFAKRGARLEPVLGLLEDPEPSVRLAALDWLEFPGFVKTSRAAVASLLTRELNRACRAVAVRCLESAETWYMELPESVVSMLSWEPDSEIRQRLGLACSRIKESARPMMQRALAEACEFECDGDLHKRHIFNLKRTLTTRQHRDECFLQAQSCIEEGLLGAASALFNAVCHTLGVGVEYHKDERPDPLLGLETSNQWESDWIDDEAELFLAALEEELGGDSLVVPKDGLHPFLRAVREPVELDLLRLALWHLTAHDDDESLPSGASACDVDVALEKGCTALELVRLTPSETMWEELVLTLGNGRSVLDGAVDAPRAALVFMLALAGVPLREAMCGRLNDSGWRQVKETVVMVEASSMGVWEAPVRRGRSVKRGR